MESLGGIIGAGIGIGMLILLGFVYVLVMALAVVSYVFSALGIGGMMKSFGMPHPGCAFIPFYNTYLLGKVAEESSLRLGDSKVKPFGKILLIMHIVTSAASFLLGFGSGIAQIIQVLVTRSASSTSEISVPGIYFFLSMLLIWIISIVIMIITIVYCVFFYIAVYKIYKCFVPKNAVLFLVLSIVFSVTAPFIFFFIRKKEPLSPVINLDDYTPEN